MYDEHRQVDQSLLERTRAAAHARCFICGRGHRTGPRLEFHEAGNGSVTARFQCGRRFEGYPETLHGGVVAALLDAAMTNCLFCQGIQAVTAELTVRFLGPASLDRPSVVTAAITRIRTPLYYLRAELTQGPSLVARATATLMNRDRAARARPPGHSPHTNIPGGLPGPPAPTLQEEDSRAGVRRGLRR